MNRAKDWLVQAGAFLSDAKKNHALKSYYLACFLSQQAAEFAIKSFCEYLGIRCWGHELVQLLKNLNIEKGVLIPDNIRSLCMVLTKYYIGTRYPDAFFSGSPVNLFSEEESNQAIESATEVFQFAADEFD